MAQDKLILCWFCQRPNEADYSTCPQCGRGPQAVVKPVFQELDFPAPPPPPPKVKTTRECPQCFKANPLDADFCNGCGSVMRKPRLGSKPLGDIPEVNNTFVWLLAVSPVLSWVIVYLIADGWRIPNPVNLWWVVLLINIFLVGVDVIQLKSQGEDTSKFSGYAWLIPAYLFVRADRFNHNAGYAWTWLAMFIISLCPVLVVVPLRFQPAVEITDEAEMDIQPQTIVIPTAEPEPAPVRRRVPVFVRPEEEPTPEWTPSEWVDDSSSSREDSGERTIIVQPKRRRGTDWNSNRSFVPRSSGSPINPYVPRQPTPTPVAVEGF